MNAPINARLGAGGAGIIRSVAFRREREANWQELEMLIELAGKRGVRNLDATQLARLPHLYRAALSSLSVARSISLDRALVLYLESLVGRAYFVVYGTRQRLHVQLKEYFTRTWPQAVRRNIRPILLSALFMIVGVVIAYVMTMQDMDRYYSFVGDMAQGRSPASSTAELRGGLYDDASVSSVLGTFASELFSHNASISMMAFALGFALGVPTLLLLLYNGITLGAFVALYISRGLGVDIWGWLLPHGITELGAIVLSGGAGLVLAQSIIFPGDKPRMDNLRERGRDAARIVIGTVIMLFIAGMIEGVFRQTVTNLEVRYAVAATTGLFWIWYFGFVGREPAVVDGEVGS